MFICVVKKRKTKKIEYCDVRGQEFEKIIKFHFVNSALVSHKSSNFTLHGKSTPYQKIQKSKLTKKPAVD